MIKGYFGTPGVGKSTNLVKIARKEQKRLIKRYKHIYTVNIDIKGCTRITKDDFLEKNKNRSIQEVFDFIKHIPVLKRTTEQHLVYTYIFTNCKKLGVK